MSCLNLRKLSRTFCGYGRRSRPSRHACGTNSRFRIRPSGQSIGSGTMPNSLHKPITAPSLFDVLAVPVANACPAYSSRYALPPQCSSFSNSRKSWSRRNQAQERPLMPPPTITMSCRAEAGGREKWWPSRNWWQISLCSPSTTGVGAGAASSDRSPGQPAATDPATTNLIKLLRSDCITLFSRCSGQDRLRRAEPIPQHDRQQRESEDRGGHGVDFGRNPTAQTRPDFERQRVVASDEKEAHRDFVHREGEDQQARADDGEAQVGHRDAPEGSPLAGGEVERGFFLRAVELLQAGEDFGGGDGDQRGAVSQHDGQQAELHAGGDEEHQQRETGDDAGQDQRQQRQAAENVFAGK